MPPDNPKWLWYIEALLAILRRVLDLIDDDPSIPVSSKVAPKGTQADALRKLTRSAEDKADIP